MTRRAGRRATTKRAKRRTRRIENGMRITMTMSTRRSMKRTTRAWRRTTRTRRPRRRTKRPMK